MTMTFWGAGRPLDDWAHFTRMERKNIEEKKIKLKDQGSFQNKGIEDIEQWYSKYTFKPYGPVRQHDVWPY